MDEKNRPIVKIMQPKPVTDKKKHGIYIFAGLAIGLMLLMFQPLFNFAILRTQSLALNYQFTDENITEEIEYYGFLDTSGAWYIMVYNMTAGEARYIMGSGNYTENWNNHTALNYSYYNEVFT